MTALAPPMAAELRGCWVFGPGPRRPQDREKDRAPIGALLAHGDHMLLVVWDAVDRNAVLTSAPGEALTIAEPVLCPTCGQRGRIVNDRWESC